MGNPELSIRFTKNINLKFLWVFNFKLILGIGQTATLKCNKWYKLL